MSKQVIDYSYKDKRRGSDYLQLMESVQIKKSEQLHRLDSGKDKITDQEYEEKVMAFIKNEIKNSSLLEQYEYEELAQRLYDSIVMYDILTPYLDEKNEDIEGISINGWNNIRVVYHSGKKIKLEPFLSPTHELTILEKLMQLSDKQLDVSTPILEGSIGDNIRIAVARTPIVDKNIGGAAYIRKLRNKVFSTEEYINYGFATKELLDFIKIACRRGCSLLIAGKVNTGKTTFLKYILSGMPNDFQINTIESDAREFNLVKHDKEGMPVNNVLHMITREHPDEDKNITQMHLVKIGLRFNGDMLPVSEMRDVEAYSAIEAGNSGNIVVSTAHAGSAQYAHKRIANLARKKYPVDFHTALVDACEAFPLCCFIHTTDDKVRRIMNICECYVEEDKIHYNTLFEFQIEENIEDENGNVKVVGDFLQINNPSKYMCERMRMYGISKNELKKLYKGGLITS